MGALNSADSVLQPNELLEFQKATTFSADEIQDLYLFYDSFSRVNEDDGHIDYEQFCLAIGLGLVATDMETSMKTPEDRRLYRSKVLASTGFKELMEMQLVKNLFSLFDTNQDGALSFREFLIGFSQF